MRWLMSVFCDWVIIAAVLALGACVCWAFWFLAWLVVGNRQHALSILAHDGAHRLAFKRKWLNDLATEILTMWPLMGSLNPYRKFHFAHHRHTGEVGLDPELAAKGGPRYRLPKTRAGMVVQFVKDLFGGGADEIIIFMRYLKPVTVMDRWGPMLWWTVAGSLLICVGLWPIVLVWFAALFTSFWACFRLRIWTEHIGTSGTHRVHLNWFWRCLFAPHGTWLHFEHHEQPQVPFYKLAALRQVTPGVPVIPLAGLFSSYSEEKT